MLTPGPLDALVAWWPGALHLPAMASGDAAQAEQEGGGHPAASAPAADARGGRRCAAQRASIATVLRCCDPLLLLLRIDRGACSLALEGWGGGHCLSACFRCTALCCWAHAAYCTIPKKQHGVECTYSVATSGYYEMVGSCNKRKRMCFHNCLTAPAP